jgi:limonene-1,2-epoxide hydrolase
VTPTPWQAVRRRGPATVSLVQIFRIRDGKIALLRDYFAPGLVT